MTRFSKISRIRLLIIISLGIKMKQLGRPDDKSKYITSVMKSLDYSTGVDGALETALKKLNATELITLNTYIAKQNRLSVDQAISLLPTKTPAQKVRVDEAVKLYKELELKNASYAEKTNVKATIRQKATFPIK